MALVTTKEMFEKAFQGGYAIGAFNINNMEIVQGVVAAAKAQNSAVILQVSKSALKYAHPKYLKAMVDAAVEETGLDIALHLDHGPDLETCKECIECGFTSVMFDGSHYDYEENVAKTKEVVEYAHARGVVVEAELGKLAGVEDDVKVDAANATYTDPDQAVDFVKRTGVDSLAIAIGTSHGAYKFKGEAKLDFDRLETITKKLEDAGFHNFPIVLHGASSVDQRCVAMCNEFGGKIDGAKGIPAEMLRKASSMAVCKINMDTDLRLAMTAAIRKSFGENPAAFDPRGYLGDARNLIQELVEDMLETMYDAYGVGLAAPQVGMLKRIVVIDVGDENGPYVLINPVIKETSGEQTGEEGCLSVPGKSGVVTRPNVVTVEALDINMEPFSLTGEGLLARAICHECEHLDGILYVEHVEGELHDVNYEEEDGE